MAVTLSRTSLEHAKKLIKGRKVVIDERDAWSEHQPSAQAENRFIKEHGLNEHGKWQLGIDEGEREGNKGHYKFPYGDLRNVHRCALLSSKSRAGQYKYEDIESAAAHLHGMLDALK